MELCYSPTNIKNKDAILTSYHRVHFRYAKDSPLNCGCKKKKKVEYQVVVSFHDKKCAF